MVVRSRDGNFRDKWSLLLFFRIRNSHSLFQLIDVGKFCHDFHFLRFEWIFSRKLKFNILSSIHSCASQIGYCSTEIDVYLHSSTRSVTARGFALHALLESPIDVRVLLQFSSWMQEEMESILDFSNDPLFQYFISWKNIYILPNLVYINNFIRAIELFKILLYLLH